MDGRNERVEIRRAETADAEAGALCHLTCWREAYAGIVEPALLFERTSDLVRRTERWAAAIAGGAVRWIAVNPDPAALSEDRVIGFSAPGPTRDEDSQVPLELYPIYVRRRWWGTGLGARLLDVAIGTQPTGLWVLEANLRARAFYRRHGFVEDGGRADEPFFDVPEIRMMRTEGVSDAPL